MPKAKECCDGLSIGRLVIRIIIAILIAALVLQVFFNIRADWFTGVFSGLFWNIIGVLILIWIISWFFRWPWYHGHWDHAHALRILRRRYAMGEISESQFKRMMKTLESEHSR
jgi:uncharacterized membrane protein